MAEYIDREAAVASLCCDCSATGDCRPGERCVDYERLKSIPAADVVEVVRCGECRHYNRKYWDSGKCYGRFCDFWHRDFGDEFYCKRGKKRDG